MIVEEAGCAAPFGFFLDAPGGQLVHFLSQSTACHDPRYGRDDPGGAAHGLAARLQSASEFARHFERSSRVAGKRVRSEAATPQELLMHLF